MNDNENVTARPKDDFEHYARALKVLAHPQRLRIIAFLAQHTRAPVHKIQVALALSQSSVSMHLAQLRQMGLISTRRQGRESWYEIANPCCLNILNCMRTPS